MNRRSFLQRLLMLPAAIKTALVTKPLVSDSADIALNAVSIDQDGCVIYTHPTNFVAFQNNTIAILDGDGEFCVRGAGPVGQCTDDDEIQVLRSSDVDHAPVYLEEVFTIEKRTA